MQAGTASLQVSTCMRAPLPYIVCNFNTRTAAACPPCMWHTGPQWPTTCSLLHMLTHVAATTTVNPVLTNPPATLCAGCCRRSCCWRPPLTALALCCCLQLVPLLLCHC
jgi:hypothetical protein